MTIAADRVVTLVDDDPDTRAAMAQLLTLAGFEVRGFGDPRAALARIDAGHPGILVTDVRMPGMSGIELFEAVRARDPELPVILVTGHGDVAMAVSALRSGAWDYLTKPFDPDALVVAATRACAARALVVENRTLRQEASQRAGATLVGDAPAIVRLRMLLPMLAAADIDVTIEGESGTGKALYARALHRGGRRSRHRLVTIDCATVPAAIVDCELFGHAGAVAQADRGTLLLVGLDRASEALQHRLARFAGERAVALDTRTPVPVDVRIVATLAHGARHAVRSELYHRIAVTALHMPALAERREDIPLLFATFVHRAAGDAGIAPPPLGDLPHRLRGRDWPGNVRELANYAERFRLGLEPDRDAAAPGGGSLAERLDAFERSLIEEALGAADLDASRAARALGLPRKTFYNRVNRLGIDLTALRRDGPRTRR